MDRQGSRGVAADQPEMPVLLECARVWRKSHGERKMSRRDQGKGLHLPRRHRWRKIRKSAPLDAQIAPAAAGQKTTYTSKSKAERQPGREDIQEVSNREPRKSGINQQRQKAEDNTSIKNHAAARITKRAPETDTAWEIEIPTEK